ncbi:MAG TPA: serine/threonine-protein kinase [Polyangiales bacterium]|nr:serine/threonine-protein kinase [Polyangiales bacterium]
MSLALQIEREDTIWDGALPELEHGGRKWLGARAGQHRIVEHLGSGGMGHVFLAEHATLGARAAVKILPAGSTAAQKLQFQQEAWLLSAQSHPNIVHLLDTGSLEDGSSYLLMEYAAGIDLGCWLQRRGDRPVCRILRILRQVACAVDHLHAQGILHRDIKPANIVIEPEADDAVKLLDFGIATREGQNDARTALVFGTPAYMAPEQAAGVPATRATDLYALGALALELLTGRPPYDYPSIPMILAAVLHERPSLPSDRGLNVPALDRFFERALSREPEQRFASARELVDALDQVLRAAPVASADVPRRTARDVGRLLAQGAVALSCAVLARLPLAQLF